MPICNPACASKPSENQSAVSGPAPTKQDQPAPRSAYDRRTAIGVIEDNGPRDIGAWVLDASGGSGPQDGDPRHHRSRPAAIYATSIKTTG
jgi:hypothetical protein